MVFMAIYTRELNCLFSKLPYAQILPLGKVLMSFASMDKLFISKTFKLTKKVKTERDKLMEIHAKKFTGVSNCPYYSFYPHFTRANGYRVNQTVVSLSCFTIRFLLQHLP